MLVVYEKECEEMAIRSGEHRGVVCNAARNRLIRSHCVNQPGCTDGFVAIHCIDVSWISLWLV